MTRSRIVLAAVALAAVAAVHEPAGAARGDGAAVKALIAESMPVPDVGPAGPRPAEGAAGAPIRHASAFTYDCFLAAGPRPEPRPSRRLTLIGPWIAELVGLDPQGNELPWTRAAGRYVPGRDPWGPHGFARYVFEGGVEDIKPRPYGMAAYIEERLRHGMRPGQMLLSAPRGGGGPASSYLCK